jgi:hypothetical protein
LLAVGAGVFTVYTGVMPIIRRGTAITRGQESGATAGIITRETDPRFPVTLGGV